MAEGYFIDLKDAKEGMRLHQPLCKTTDNSLLLSRGVVLNKRVIQQLNMHFKDCIGNLCIERVSGDKIDETNNSYTVKSILKDLNNTVVGIQGSLASIELVLSLIEEDSTLREFLDIINTYDHATLVHSLNVGVMTAIFLDKLTIVDNNAVKMALLHDLGKTKIPLDIINKKGKVSDDEYKTVKEHSRLGYYTLKSVKKYDEHLAGVLQHHERWDGSGYPNRLRGENICFNARVYALIDTLDALISKRPYKQPTRFEDAVLYINKKSGILFDPDITSEFSAIYRGKSAIG